MRACIKYNNIAQQSHAWFSHQANGYVFDF